MKNLHYLIIVIFTLSITTAGAQEKFGKGEVTQIGLVVKDITKASQKWAAILGFSEIPEPIITDEYKKAHTEYNGNPSDARAKLVFFRLQNLTIELIEPVGKKSTWYEHLKKYGEGIHHIAFNVDGMEKNISRLESKGGKLLQKGDFTGGSYSYVDLPDVGVIFELLTSTGN